MTDKQQHLLEQLPGWHNFSEAFFTRTIRKTVEEWVTIAEKLASDKKGVLPHSYWLAKKGYNGLHQCMRAYPEKFAHIPQDRKRRTPEEWVQTAETLASEHEGVLPNDVSLRRLGYEKLVVMMCKKPQAFEHIAQAEAMRKTASEWVLVAEKLAASRNGKLPHYAWLIGNGYKGLAPMITKYPEMFSHIEQDNKEGNTVDDHVKTAERIAAENDGELPHTAWLLKNGYNSLYQCLSKYRTSFAHIPQAKSLLKTVEEWVPIAEQIATEKGAIPNSRTLIKMGLSGLALVIRNNPAKFAHIAQVKSRRTPEEWVPIAETLASNNNGYLPPLNWLKENGHSGLALVVRNNPKLFKHIKQR